MSWWQALNYGMAGVATGGFGVTDNSAGESGTGARMIIVLLMLLGTLLLLHAAGPGAALDHVLLEASSALGNAGLTTGITSTHLAWWGKLGVIVLMWMGRVEVVPLLVVLVAVAGGPRRWRRRS